MRLSEIAPWLLAFAGLGSGLWAWLAARVKGKTDLVTVAQQAAQEVIDDLRTDVDRARLEAEKLRDRVAGLEQGMIDLSREHEALRRANEAVEQLCADLRQQNQRLVGELDARDLRITQLEGELRQKQQVITSMGSISET